MSETATKKDYTDKLSKGRKCMGPNCEESAKWKGLCGSCYHAAKTLIAEEGTSWEELGDLGMCLVPSQAFRNEFRKRKQVKDSLEDGQKPT